MTGAAALALGAGVLAGRWRGPEPGVVVMAVVALTVVPAATVAAGFFAWALARFRRAAAETRDGRALEVAALEVGDLIGLGLAGGLSAATACQAARAHCQDILRADLDRLIASMNRHGIVPALALERGPLSGITTSIGTAVASGAPVLPALDAHLRQEHHRLHIEGVEAARRLPVRLLVPLTLLVLPGFVLIAVGPAVIDSLARLSP